MAGAFSLANPYNAQDMLNAFRNNMGYVISTNSQQTMPNQQISRSGYSLYLFGKGENHVLDLLLKNTGTRISASLPISVLAVRNAEGYLIVQVLEINRRIYGGGGVGAYYGLTKNEITCASLYFTLQKRVYPMLRMVSPAPGRAGLDPNSCKKLIRR